MCVCVCVCVCVCAHRYVCMYLRTPSQRKMRHMVNFYVKLIKFELRVSFYASCLTKIKETRHAGHSWRSRDELISDVLLWTPTHGRAKAGRPARTYIQQLCEDTGCCPEDLPEAMNDREKWRERVRDICATSTT